MRVLIALVMLSLAVPAFSDSAGEQNAEYVRQGQNQSQWDRTSDEKLIEIVKHPEKFKPEEYAAALHALSSRRNQSKMDDGVDFLILLYREAYPYYLAISDAEAFTLAAIKSGIISLTEMYRKDPSLASLLLLLTRIEAATARTPPVEAAETDLTETTLNEETERYVRTIRD